MKICFDGATNTVTGSKHIIVTDSGKRILLDCGLFQGRGSDVESRNRNFNFIPSEINALLLSHAHIDHSGNIPLLVKQGYSGKIYCTPATAQICAILLRDSAHIHEGDIIYINKKRIKKNLPPLEPLYTVADAEKCLRQFEPIEYEKWNKLFDDCRFMFTDAGHILGSATVNLILKKKEEEISICFTGDVGRENNSLLKPPAKFPAPNYLITESTYGDRNHATENSNQRSLIDIINQTCVINKGKLLIPAFSLGRTQELIFALNNLKNAKALPDIKVYVDSPLSTNATNIMREYKYDLNENVRQVMLHDDDPFGFNNLSYVQDVKDSKKLNDTDEPCIIISASGMLDAGRIKHHLKNNIGDKKSTLLIVGYCTPESLGGKLKSKAKKVKIFGEEYKVNINVEILEEYSGHAGQDELLRFLNGANTNKLKKVFLVHGEDKVKITFREKLFQAGFVTIEIPKQGQEFEI